MIMKEYLVRLSGFYRRASVHSIPQVAGVLLVFNGIHEGNKTCHIINFLKAIGADDLQASAIKQVSEFMPEASSDGSEEIYFAYIEIDAKEINVVVDLLNRKFLENEAVVTSAERVDETKNYIHFQMEGAVPIIWNNNRSFDIAAAY